MNSQKRVMLLIDADNVSADVIEQAVGMILAEHGAIHVRRAYCTAESALANLKLFTAHSIRPIVNLSTGKNSTDIALAVDAMDLVVAERPDIAIIVSSDSDFAPLVIRLREKGCRVEGIGQLGKTGEDSKPVYDHFFDIAHRKGAGGRAGAAKAPAKRATRGRSRAAATAAEEEPASSPSRADAVEPAPARAPRQRAAARSEAASEPRSDEGRRTESRTAGSRTAEPGTAESRTAESRRGRGARSPRAAKADAGSPARAVPADDAAPASHAVPESAAAPAAPRAARPVLPDDLRRILAVLPELARGGRMELGLAAERLRSENLLSRSAPSSRLFKKYPDWFLLTPEQQPNKVEYRGFGAAA